MIAIHHFELSNLENSQEENIFDNYAATLKIDKNIKFLSGVIRSNSHTYKKKVTVWINKHPWLNGDKEYIALNKQIKNCGFKF